MKKKFNYLKSVLILFTLTNFVSCTTYYYDALELENSNKSNLAYSKIFYSQGSFEASYGWDVFSYLFYYDDKEEIYIFSHPNYGNKFTGYVDARTPEGYSTWSNPRFEFTYDSGSSSAPPLTNHTHYYKSQITMSSPPAHLHLCLKKLDEEPYSGSKKTWKMVSINDENGNSLSDDPDWTNYTDNLMTFKKADKFTYVPGAKRSKIELDYFGTEKEHPEIYGTYTVKEDASKKVTLTVAFPKFTQAFEVVSSSWTNLVLKATVNGKTGICQLVPVN